MKKLKPFDLKTALNGEPVILRNGEKAFIRHHETELETEIGEDLLGYVQEIGLWSWCVDGTSSLENCESGYDIIGMYPRTRTVNGFEVPAPETEAPYLGSEYFVATVTLKKFFEGIIWRDDEFDRLWLKRGLVFLNEEDAIANAKAMIGTDPDSPSMN